MFKRLVISETHARFPRLLTIVFENGKMFYLRCIILGIIPKHSRDRIRRLILYFAINYCNS